MDESIYCIKKTFPRLKSPITENKLQQLNTKLLSTGQRTQRPGRIKNEWPESVKTPPHHHIKKTEDAEFRPKEPLPSPYCKRSRHREDRRPPWDRDPEGTVPNFSEYTAIGRMHMEKDSILECRNKNYCPRVAIKADFAYCDNATTYQCNYSKAGKPGRNSHRNLNRRDRQRQEVMRDVAQRQRDLSDRLMAKTLDKYESDIEPGSNQNDHIGTFRVPAQEQVLKPRRIQEAEEAEKQAILDYFKRQPMCGLDATNNKVAHWSIQRKRDLEQKLTKLSSAFTARSQCPPATHMATHVPTHITTHEPTHDLPGDMTSPLGHEDNSDKGHNTGVTDGPDRTSGDHRCGADPFLNNRRKKFSQFTPIPANVTLPKDHRVLYQEPFGNGQTMNMSSYPTRVFGMRRTKEWWKI